MVRDSNPGRVSAVTWRYLLAVLLVAGDQLTKLWASTALEYVTPVPLLPFLNLTLVHNSGAAFSMLADAGGWQRWFFVALSAVVSLALVAWIARLPAAQRLLGSALALVLGGAAGNLVDRVRFGYVVDFVDLHAAGWHWPAFNVADAAITVGAILLLADGLRSHAATRAEKR
jgi:signal peptidase II